MARMARVQYRKYLFFSLLFRAQFSLNVFVPSIRWYLYAQCWVLHYCFFSLYGSDYYYVILIHWTIKSDTYVVAICLSDRPVDKIMNVRNWNVLKSGISAACVPVHLCIWFAMCGISSASEWMHINLYLFCVKVYNTQRPKVWAEKKTNKLFWSKWDCPCRFYFNRG